MRNRAVALLAALPLAACGTKREAPPPVVTPPPVVATRPVPPLGASPGFVPPPRLPDGSYATPNRNLSPQATLWHLRTGLNVAALACRDPGETTRVAGYNAVLAAHRADFAAAHQAMEQEYRARYGKEWQDRLDDAMTRLYNFWALPPVQRQLCAAADAVLADAPQVTEDAMGSFAEGALARLEAPFTDFFADYDAYRMALAAWQGPAAAPMIAPVPTSVQPPLATPSPAATPMPTPPPRP